MGILTKPDVVPFKEKRKRVSVEERVIPCDICLTPLSDRHHILNFKIYGESLHTAQFCPTCHVLFHIAESAILYNRKRASKVWAAFCQAKGEHDGLVIKVQQKVLEALELMEEMDLAHGDY